MDCFGNTDIGRKRKANQDSFCICELGDKAILCAVFDGMGGHAGGETASRIACEKFKTVVCETLTAKLDSQTQTIDATKTQLFNVLCKAADVANTAVFDAAAENEELHGMGTTLAAVLINGPYIYTINIGDSRVYLISDSEIKQISHDHSYVQYLIDIGEITEEEAKTNANKSIITRAVGTSESIEADTFVAESEGMCVLLCTDGLTNHVDNSGIFDIISQGCCAKDTVDKLIDTANENGGSDDITAILVRP